MARYRKKPVVVEALQISRPMTVETLEGVMRGEPGDMLITGVKGEQYFCKLDIFEATYEPVEGIRKRAKAAAEPDNGAGGLEAEAF